MDDLEYATALYEFRCSYCPHIITVGEVYRRDEFVEDSQRISKGLCIPCAIELELAPETPPEGGFAAHSILAPRLNTEAVLAEPCSLEEFGNHVNDLVESLRFAIILRLGWYMYLDSSLKPSAVSNLSASGSKLLNEKLKTLQVQWREAWLEAERYRAAAELPSFRDDPDIIDLTARFAVKLKFPDIEEELPDYQLFRSDDVLHKWRLLFKKYRAKFPSESFEDFLWRLLNVADGLDEARRIYLAQAVAEWRSRTIRLDQDLIGTVHTVSDQYLQWLAHHPDSLERIAWEALERIVAEVFCSAGFSVDFTARCRNRSADLMALRTESAGEVRYLIECKRYRADRKVGISIVNQVLGAKQRASVDFAFLVSTSSFTRDVISIKPQLANLRLHLRDGEDIRAWLKHYRVRSDRGVYLAQGWNL